MPEPPGILDSDIARIAQQAKRASATMEIPPLIGEMNTHRRSVVSGPKGESAEPFELLILDVICLRGSRSTSPRRSAASLA